MSEVTYMQVVKIAQINAYQCFRTIIEYKYIKWLSISFYSKRGVSMIISRCIIIEIPSNTKPMMA